MKNQLLLNTIIFLTIVTIFLEPLSAQELQGPIQVKIPQLGNHRFVTNPFVRDPFIKTTLRNTLGFGQAIDMKLPILVLGDDTVWGFRGDLMFVKLEFEYQYAFKRWMDWISVANE